MAHHHFPFVNHKSQLATQIQIAGFWPCKQLLSSMKRPDLTGDYTLDMETTNCTDFPEV